MSGKSRKEKRELWVRVLAIALAALLIGMIVAQVLPVFGLAEEAPPPEEAVVFFTRGGQLRRMSPRYFEKQDIGHFLSIAS